MPDIGLDGITKRFGSVKAVDELTLTLADGEFFVLLGPTGAGKTTTLRLIAGLDLPDAGRISIGGEDATGWSVAQRDVALVFQYYSLYPRYTVRQNLAFPLRSKVRNFTPDEIERRVARAAKMLRIEHLLERKTDKLSGGEMQRVSIGRAIVRDPTVFLMDEPLVEPRRQAARGAALGAQGPARHARRHLPLRHPRPDRGDVDGRPDRGAERGPAGAGRHPERDLRRAARHLRRDLRRLAGDEPPRRR